MKEYISTKKKNTHTHKHAHTGTQCIRICMENKNHKEEEIGRRQISNNNNQNIEEKNTRKKNLNQKKYTAGELRSYSMVRHEFIVKLHLTHKISKPMTLVLIIPSCFCQ